MDQAHNRGRSPSGSNHLRHSPSPHAQFSSNPSAFDPSLSDPSANLQNTFSTSQPSRLLQHPTFQSRSADFPNGQRNRIDPLSRPQPDEQLAAFTDTFPSQSQVGNPQLDQFGAPNELGHIGNLDHSLQQYQTPNIDFTNLDPSQFEDFLDFNPQFPDSGVYPDGTPVSFNNMSTTHQQVPDPPHLLQPGMQQQSGHGSSDLGYQEDYSPSQHSPNTSLDPSSAELDQSAQWHHRGHHRVPSDQRSDVSSNGNTPYLDAADSFEPYSGGPSPMLNGAGDSSVFGPDALGLDHFSLNDPNHQHISPGHSSHPSPYLGPQQGIPPAFPGQEGLGFNMENQQYHDPQMKEKFTSNEAFPAMPQLQHSDSQRGEADTMSPPVITFQPAPPSKQNSFNDMAETARQANLSPPQSSLTRPGGRQRAISDPNTGTSSRGTSPVRPRSPSTGAVGLHPANSLGVPRSRSGSRGSTDGVNKNHYRRESSPVNPQIRSPEQQERMMDMVRQASSGSPGPSEGGSDAGASPGSTSGYEGSPENRSTGGNKSSQKQKHPATFECHLCTKRFTRAYNLRSHLRTHTDERPFVCTVCGKAFARQHDRKRHEGLHSGEKKFVCKGELQDANGQKTGTWGCGRRFARADALGRHFRSEAGRSCIKPLLDEEARHRRQDAFEQQSAHMMHAAQAAQMQQQQGIPTSMPMQQSQNIDVGSMPLPAALLQQYPALAGIDLNQPMTMGGSDYDVSDYGDDPNDYDFENSARGSFDAPRSSYEGDGGYEDYNNNGYNTNQQVPMDPNFAMQGQGMGQPQWSYQQ